MVRGSGQRQSEPNHASDRAPNRVGVERRWAATAPRHDRQYVPASHPIAAATCDNADVGKGRWAWALRVLPRRHQRCLLPSCRARRPAGLDLLPRSKGQLEPSNPTGGVAPPCVVTAPGSTQVKHAAAEISPPSPRLAKRATPMRCLAIREAPHPVQVTCPGIACRRNSRLARPTSTRDGVRSFVSCWNSYYRFQTTGSMGLVISSSGPSSARSASELSLRHWMLTDGRTCSS